MEEHKCDLLSAIRTEVGKAADDVLRSKTDAMLESVAAAVRSKVAEKFLVFNNQQEDIKKLQDGVSNLARELQGAKEINKHLQASSADYRNRFQAHELQLQSLRTTLSGLEVDEIYNKSSILDMQQPKVEEHFQEVHDNMESRPSAFVKEFHPKENVSNLLSPDPLQVTASKQPKRKLSALEAFNNGTLSKRAKSDHDKEYKGKTETGNSEKGSDHHESKELNPRFVHVDRLQGLATSNPIDQEQNKSEAVEAETTVSASQSINNWVSVSSPSEHSDKSTGVKASKKSPVKKDETNAPKKSPGKGRKDNGPGSYSDDPDNINIPTKLKPRVHVHSSSPVEPRNSVQVPVAASRKAASLGKTTEMSKNESSSEDVTPPPGLKRSKRKSKPRLLPGTMPWENVSDKDLSR